MARKLLPGHLNIPAAVLLVYFSGLLLLVAIFTISHLTYSSFRYTYCYGLSNASVPVSKTRPAGAIGTS